MDIKDVLSLASPSPQHRRSFKPPPPQLSDNANFIATENKRLRLQADLTISDTSLAFDLISNGTDNEDYPPTSNLSTDDTSQNSQTTVGASEITVSTVRRLTLLLEKRAMVNQEARTKFPDQPKRFMQSELDLQETLEEMQILAANPNLYPVVAEQSRAVSVLLSLLAHENTDISLTVVDLLHELLESQGLIEAGPEKVNPLLDLLFGGQFIHLLIQNVSRLDESKSDEAEGVHKSLGIIENILDVRPEMNVIMSNQGLFTWLLRRLQRRPQFDRNKLYASEILSILLQLDEANRSQLGQVEGIDILLQQLAVYKRVDPSSREELEMMHNLFDCLCSALMFPENKDRFLKGEGIQLMNLMLREKHLSRDSALRVLDYALCLVSSLTSATVSSTTPAATPIGTLNPLTSLVDTGQPKPTLDAESVVSGNCAKFVEVLGLRTIFPLFMHNPKERPLPSNLLGVVNIDAGAGAESRRKSGTGGGPTAAEMQEHVINIVAALLRYCPAALKSRVVAKFVENDHEKIDRLVELHWHYFVKVKIADKRTEKLRLNTAHWAGYTQENIEEELMLERLGSGLLPLQMLDIIMIDVCVNGPPSVVSRVQQLLKMRGYSFRNIVDVVQGHIDNLGNSNSSEMAQKTHLEELLHSFSTLLP